MTTYIYHKDSTLMAFECEQREVKGASGHIIMAENQAAMSTAQESALPVVNYIDVAILIGDKCYSRTLSPQIEFKTEPVALPGWGLENTYQLCPSGNWHECSSERRTKT